jgi:hypothetical protein
MSTDDADHTGGKEYRGPELPTRANATTGRSLPFPRMDGGLWGDGHDQSTRLYDALNYPSERDLDFNTWLSFLRREGWIGGLLTKFVQDTWQGGAPEVVDADPTGGEEERDETDFEAAVADLFENDHDDLDLRAPLLDRLIAADTLGRLGEYSILVFGFKDDNSVDEELKADTADGFADLAYVEVYAEDDVDYDLETDLNSDQYGRPGKYEVDTDDGTQAVHPSRVVHNPGVGTLVDPYSSQPFFKDIANRIVDGQKILGASGEGYFRGGYPGIVLKPPDTLKNIGSTGSPRIERVPGTFSDDGSDLAREIEEVHQRFERTMTANGEVEQLTPNVSSPADHMAEQWAAIAAAKDVSQSIVKGNETGERATTEDNAAYRSKIAGDRNTYAEPQLFRGSVDRLTYAGVLSAPDGDGYDVEWPPLSERDEKEEADIENTKASALNTATGGQPTAAATIPEIRKHVLGMDPERGSEAPESESKQDEQERDVQAILDRMGISDGDGQQGTAPGTEAAMGSVDEPSGMANPTERMTTPNARQNAETDGGERIAEDGGTQTRSGDESGQQR